MSSIAPAVLLAGGDEQRLTVRLQSSPRFTLAAVFGLLALIAVGTWLLLRSSTDAPSRHSPARTSAPIVKWQAQTVRRGLQELAAPGNRDLPPLALTGAPPQLMPLAMRRAVHQTIGNSSVFRLHLDRAHFVQTPLGGGLWLVEGNGVTCAFRARVGSSTCRTTVQARRHGLLLETYRTKGRGGAPTNFLALGIAPGWVRSALVRIAGEQQVIEVIKHGYALRAKDPIEVERLKR